MPAPLFQDPQAATAIQLLQQPGEYRARALSEIANAQANAQMQGAAAWSGAVNTIGQNVAGTIQQMTDPRRKLEEIALAEAQQRQKGQQLIDRTLKGGPSGGVPNGPQEEGAPPAAAQHPYLDEYGLVDPAKVNDLLNANGFGHVAPDLLKGIDTQNDAIVKHNELQTKLGKQQAIMYGSVANTTLKLMELGMPFEQASQHASSSLTATGAVKAEQLQPLLASIAQLPRDQQIAQLQTLKKTAAQLAPTHKLGKDETEYNIFDEQIASNMVPDKLTAADLEGRALDAYGRQAAGTATPADLNTITAWEKLHPKTPPKTSAEQDDERYRTIQSALEQKQPVPVADMFWAKAYERQKTLGVDSTAAAAGIRQSKAIEAQTAQQTRAQSFQEAQQGRKELTEKVEVPYQTAQASAQTLRDVVASAKAGNRIAASLQSLETTMSAIRAQGLNRINSAEIGVTADAGSLWDRIVGKVGKLASGDVVDEKLQKDMQQFASILEKASYKKYSDAWKSVTTRYGLKDEKPLAGPNIYARDGKGVLHSAPFGTTLPKGWVEE